MIFDPSHPSSQPLEGDADAPHGALLGGLPLDLAGAAAIRAAADGELDAAGLSSLNAAQPDLADRVDFDRTLRSAVARAMGGVSAPAALRSRVQSMAAAHRDDPPRSLPFQPAPAPLRFAPVRWAAIAALFILSSAVIYLGYSQAQHAGYFGPPSGVQLATFIRLEHGQCARFSSHFERKFEELDQDQADEAANSILGSLPPMIKLPVAGLSSAGYEFAGIGRCAVPGRGRSAHLLFARPQNQYDSPISLFVQVDTGQLSIAHEFGYAFGPSDAVAGGPIVWRRDGFLYYLYCESPEILRVAEEALHLPTEIRPFGS